MSKYANEMALNQPKEQAKNTSLNMMFLAAKIAGINPKNRQYLNMLDRFIINCIKNN